MNPLNGLVDEIQKDVHEAQQKINKGFHEGDKDYVGKTRKDRLADNLRKASIKATESAKRRRYITLDAAVPKAAATGVEPAPLQS